MKVSIIGGGGLVGSCAGFALQAGKIVSEINLIDVNQELCECGFGVAGLRLGFARGVGVVVFEHCSRHISVAHACTLHK